MSQDHKYSAADFERYHSGQMSEAEMHALEKAALKDPFLADALEGYAYTVTAKEDINELKQKLFAKREKKNVFAIMAKQNKWMRIAALFILIAGIGYLAYQLNFNKRDNMLARKENRSGLKETTKPPIVFKSDSLLLNEKKDIADAVPPARNKHKSTDTYNRPSISNDDLDKRSSAGLAQQNLQKSVMSNAQRDLSFSRDMNILKGRLVDTLGKPVSYATVKDKNTKTVTLSDSGGRFMLVANDSSTTAMISKVGYKTKEKVLNDKAEQVIVVENDNRALNEVVVTGLGTQRQKKQLRSAPALESKVQGITVDNATSEPVTGWKKFNEYILANLTIPEDENGNNYKGKVVLSFEINKKGNPKKIKVEQSLCSACDEEATRLLEQGPKWKYIKDKRLAVTIQF